MLAVGLAVGLAVVRAEGRAVVRAVVLAVVLAVGLVVEVAEGRVICLQPRPLSIYLPAGFVIEAHVSTCCAARDCAEPSAMLTIGWTHIQTQCQVGRCCGCP